MSGKYFSWRSKSSLWARSRTFCLEVKMRSHGFQASTKPSHPRQPTTGKCLSYLSALGLIWLQTDGLFEGLEKGVFGSVVHLDLSIIVGMLAKPVVWHFSGDWGQLPWSPQQITWTFRCSDQSATLAGVPDQVVELALVSHKPSCQSLAICFCALGELADDGAGLVPALGQPDLSLILEGDDPLPNLEALQQARLCQEGKKLCRGPTAFGACEVPPKPGRDDGMAGSLKLPFSNLGEACAYVFWKRAIDCYRGHAVSRMSEPLEIGFGFTHAPEGCRIAGLHVDADNFPRVIIH